MLSNVAYAMAPPPGAQVTGFDTFMSFAPLMLLFVIFYFFIIRPQNKKQQATKEMIANLKEGDRVLTQGGLIGTISKIRDEELTVEVAKDVRVKINRHYIISLVEKQV